VASAKRAATGQDAGITSALAGRQRAERGLKGAFVNTRELHEATTVIRQSEQSGQWCIASSRENQPS